LTRPAQTPGRDGIDNPNCRQRGLAINTASLKKLAILLLVAALAAVFFQQGWHEQLTFANLKARQAELQAATAARPVLWIAGFFVAYVLMAALSLPGATIMTLAAGLLFGLGVGTVVVSFASSIGATLAMLVARYVFGDEVQRRYGAKLRRLNEGIEREGAFYLFTLRLIPIFPFFLINLGMGLTRMPARTFYWVSQLGMLPGTAVYVNAGTQLAQIDSPSGLLSPGLLGAFALLGLFPLIARRIVALIKARRVYRGHRRPRSFDYNVVVIGAGSAGLVASYVAAAVKAKVALIEKHKMGGDCLNTGCVPSKALIRSAKMLHYARRAEDWGFRSATVDYDFGEVMQRVHRVIETVEPHDSVERYQSLGVDCIQGEARIESPWTVRVGDRLLTTRNVIVATGATPLVPPIPGLDQVDPLTSDNLWQLKERPERLVVLGGGPIGSEMAQAFARLGSQVTQIEMLPRILSREDPDVSALVLKRFEEEGVRVLTGHKAKSFGKDDDGQAYVLCETADGGEVRVDFDRVLVALGRRARTRGFGLEELGVEVDRTVRHDDFMRTNFPNVYVCGDVAGPYQFTHTAAHQAWYAAVNALFSPLKTFRADYRVIPWTTFTDPEVAKVGLNELEAREQGVPYEVTTYGIDDLDRAIADGEAYGMVKVLTVPGKDRILGATIVGPHAGDLLAEYVLAMKHGVGLNKILGTVHPYPTLAEANKYAAGNWRKAHAPERLLRWLERFHGWRRGEPMPALAKAAVATLAVLLLAAVGAGVAAVSDGAPAATATAADPAATATSAETSAFSYAAYARVLERVDERGLVDYAGLKAEPGDLDAFRSAVAALDRTTFEAWDDDARIAFWINAYNALTLYAIVDHYPLERGLRNAALTLAHPRGIRWIPNVWDTPYTVMGEALTLNDIEHKILRVDYDEPRIHAALVCAAMSCPPLRGEPFVAERLDRQLDDQVRRWLARPESGLRIDRQAAKVYLSKIFDWYGEDFVPRFAPGPDRADSFAGHGERERAVLNFVSHYLGEEDRAYLEAGRYELDYLPYDWSLNEQPAS